MAAQIIADGHAIEVFRVDLTRTLSNYIGETKKNLNAIFDAAENFGRPCC